MFNADAPEIVAAPLMSLAEQYVAGTSPPLLSVLVDAARAEQAEARAREARKGGGRRRKAKANSIVEKMRSAAPAARKALLVAHMETKVKAMLGLAADYEVDSHEPLSGLGLDSLMVMELRNTVKADTGVLLAPDALIAHPDLDGISGVILSSLESEMGDSAGGGTSTTEGSGEDGIVALTPPSGGGAGATPLFFVQGAGRGTDLFAELARLLGADQPFYELRTTGLAPQSADNADASEREFGFSSVESLAARFAAAMCRLQPEGEFELGLRS